MRSAIPRTNSSVWSPKAASSFLASSIVGPKGSVVGVDRSSQAIAVATQRAEQARTANVRFVATDLSELTLGAPVDAIVGRLVLMYFPKPADVLRSLLRFLKPGGLVVFQEIDGAGVASEPMCDEFRVAGERITETFRHAGVDTRAGIKVPAVFQQAGLPAPQTLQMARVEQGPTRRATRGSQSLPVRCCRSWNRRVSRLPTT